jgi:hypothetical protein
MFKRITLVLGIILVVSGCAQYTLVDSKAPVDVRGMTITTNINWTQLPPIAVASDKATYWTLDGILLNQLMLFGEVAEGDKLFKSSNKEISMPSYRTDMLPNEIQELITSSLKNISGGTIDITSKNLRPQKFGDLPGFAFDIEFYNKPGLLNRGKVVASTSNDQLYIIAYVAPDLHYYENYIDKVDYIVSSVRLTKKQ